MQLEKIVIYSNEGASRVVEFQPGRLNIVTGVSRRGKSALVEIVDYCFGRSDFSVPTGKVRDNVSWYGVLLEHDGERTWLLRPRPREGAESTSSMMLIPGAGKDVPEFETLAANADTGSARDHLSSQLGISLAEIPRPPGRLRPGLRVSIAQAVLLCLQGQNELTSKTKLFHRQEDQAIEDDLRAALPYLLGAVPAEVPALRAQLIRARRDLQRASKRYSVALSAASDADDRAAALVVEAEAAGLELADEGTPLERLEGAKTSEPKPSQSSQTLRLLAERSQIVEAQAETRRRLQSLRALEEDAQAFAVQATEQGSRLQSLELLRTPDAVGGAACPLCGTAEHADHPSASDLRAALETLTSDIASVGGFTPRAEKAITELEQEAEGQDEALRAVNGALSDLAAQGDALADQVNVERAQVYAQGRIAEYVRVAKDSTELELDQLKAAVDRTEDEVQRLEADLDLESQTERIDTELDRVSELMTRYGRELELEHTDPPATLHLNLGRMTAVARTEDGPKWLPTIGGGSNWVGYHLATHLALHLHFLRRDRPVPSFLMLDQPTQAFYPEDLPAGEHLAEEDLDRTLVRKWFRVLLEAVDAIDGKPLQIIVCDHAKLTEEEWFMECVGDNDWRGDKGLIPTSWETNN